MQIEKQRPIFLRVSVTIRQENQMPYKNIAVNFLGLSITLNCLFRPSVTPLLKLSLVLQLRKEQNIYEILSSHI
jgi:hypothetical protein